VVATDMALGPLEALTMVPTVRDSGITSYGGGDFFSIGGHFALTGSDAGHMRSEDPVICEWGTTLG
jgi:hypothetical protein